MDRRCKREWRVCIMPILNAIYSHVLMDGIEEDKRWDDILSYYEISRSGMDLRLPTAIDIWNGSLLDKIQVHYGNDAMQPHGINEPGGRQTFKFAANEYITKVAIEANKTFPDGVPVQIGRLEFVTNIGKIYEFHSWDATYKGQRFEFKLPSNAALVAIGGRFGGGINVISGLTLHYRYLDSKYDKTECEIYRDTNDSIAFKGVYYKTLCGSITPKSDVWINFIEVIDIPQGCDLLCASISSEEHKIDFPLGVYSAMFDTVSQLSAQETDKEHVHVMGENFHQMFIVKPTCCKYKILIRQRVDAQIFVEYQTILKNSENISMVQSERIKENCIPYYSRPLQRLLLMHEVNGWGEVNNTKRTFAAPLPYQIFAFAKIHPFLTASLIIACGVSVVLGLSKPGKNRLVKSMKLLKKNAKWSVTQKGNRKIYKTFDPPDYTPHAYLSKKPESKADLEALALYQRLLDRNQNDMRVSKMKRIEKSDLHDMKIVVDIGGEGCFEDVGVRVAGVNCALNLNGKYTHNEMGCEIPLLIHFSHWDTENFPFEDGIVDTFIMQATPPPTLKQADEIIRCLNKESGRFHLISNGWDDKELMCFQYIRTGLELELELKLGSWSGQRVRLYEGDEMVHEEYPQLVGARYLTI